VGLCRSAGVPARDVYGLRLAPSAFGYRELGGNPANLKGAQHCRAEVYLRQHGWVAMDPADVLKVMRQETRDWIKDPKHPLVAPVAKGLFGAWEGNWVAWNTAHDVTLPGSAGKGTLPFLMYPNGENASGRFDELAPDARTSLRSEVTPASTFSMPSWRSVRMPSAIADAAALGAGTGLDQVAQVARHGHQFVQPARPLKPVWSQCLQPGAVGTCQLAVAACAAVQARQQLVAAGGRGRRREGVQVVAQQFLDLGVDVAGRACGIACTAAHQALRQHRPAASRRS
jgi:hypothetical protein